MVFLYAGRLNRYAKSLLIWYFINIHIMQNTPCFKIYPPRSMFWIRKYIFIAFYWIWIYGEAHCSVYFDLFVFVKKLEIKRQSITFYMAAGTFTSKNGLSESEVSFKIYPLLRVEILQLHGYRLHGTYGFP